MLRMLQDLDERQCDQGREPRCVAVHDCMESRKDGLQQPREVGHPMIDYRCVGYGRSGSARRSITRRRWDSLIPGSDRHFRLKNDGLGPRREGVADRVRNEKTSPAGYLD